MNELAAYAYDFISYLTLQDFFSKYPLRKIILYGSSTRKDYKKQSDIDIFIDISNLKTVDELTKKIEKTKDNFAESERMKKWNILNIKNEFSIIIGNVEDKKWSDLRRSMHSHGVVVWERYREKSEDLDAYALIKWSPGTKDANKRINLARKLYGYSQKGKKYKGLFEMLGIKPVDNGIALVPSEYLNNFREVFNKLNVRCVIKDVFVRP